MTDTMTSQNIVLSSWDTLYKKEKLRAERFHTTLMKKMEFFSETLDFITHLIRPSAPEDLNEFCHLVNFKTYIFTITCQTDLSSNYVLWIKDDCIVQQYVICEQLFSCCKL
jgi:hypothetical protein